MKTILLALAMLVSAPAWSDPLVYNTDEPVVMIPKSEFDAFMAEVKKLSDEYKALANSKSCKKT
jgi:hypothetical protein